MGLGSVLSLPLSSKALSGPLPLPARGQWQPARAPPAGTHVMTSVSSPGSLSSPSTNTEVLVKLCVLQVTPSSTLNLPTEGCHPHRAGRSAPMSRPSCPAGHGPARTQGPALLWGGWENGQLALGLPSVWAATGPLVSLLGRPQWPPTRTWGGLHLLANYSQRVLAVLSGYHGAGVPPALQLSRPWKNPGQPHTVSEPSLGLTGQ